MILVDERIGSRELLAAIRSTGNDAELTRLDAGDFAFSGNGDPDFCACPYIGIERKTISDLVSSMRGDHRLAGHQHVQLSRIYDECYLIVEGIWRRNRDDGYLEVMNGSWHKLRGNVKYAEVDRFLCSLEIQGGIRLWRTSDERETAAAVADRYTWWQKPWHDHKAMQTIYAPVNEPKRRGHKPSMLRQESSLAEKIASQLPGIDSKATQVAAHFGSVIAMITSDSEEWSEVKGIGTKGAKRIVESIWAGSAEKA